MARSVLSRVAMPSSMHEAPLALVRERPELVVELLRDLLGVAVPPYRAARVIEADLTQLVPTEYRADLVVELEGDGGGLAVIVEVQRQVDERKCFAWPLYAAALHARRRGATCLVVVALDAAVAVWAARPIASVQPGSPFTPLVIGPERIPRSDPSSPELAILSALAHGASTDGERVIGAAVAAIPALAPDRAALYFDLLLGALGDVARSALENVMRAYKYEYQSDFAKKYFGEGLEKGREEGRRDALRAALRVLLETRLGAVPATFEPRLADATADQLLAWISAASAAPDAEAALAALTAG